MTMSSSSKTTIIPKRFCGLRVLLVEPDRSSLQHHADMLKLNSYRVTTTTNASNALSMLMNEDTYDCVLIDADTCETDMAAFLDQVLRHQPQMSIVLMASDDIHLKIPKQALENEAVLCLPKPCSLRAICNVWKHVCRNRISFEENVSKEKLNNKDQRVNPSISSGNSTDHQASDVNSQECEVTYENLFSNDDDSQEDVGIGTTKKSDKGKQPFIQKRKNDHPVEDYRYPKRREEFKTRVTWKGELDEKFNAAMKDLGNQAHSSAILKHMNVPGLTRFQVASHLQKYQKKQKIIEASIAALAQRGNSLQVERFANKIRRSSTQCDDEASVIDQSSNLQRSSMLNYTGIRYMVIENVRTKLQEARPPLPLCFGATAASNYNLQIDNSCLLSGIGNGKFGDARGSGLRDVQEDLALPGFIGCDARGLGPPVFPHSATRFDVENCINQGSSLDSVPFGLANGGFSVPKVPTEGNDCLAEVELPVNSSVPSDDSEVES